MSLRIRFFSVRLVLALWLTHGVVLGQGVVIVDASGSKHFSDIQAAVDAAVDGDILLVTTGIYKEFTIDGKGLSIFALPGTFVTVNGEARIKNLTWQRVVLSGLRLVGGFYNGYFVESSPGLTVLDSTGHVRIQGCYIAGGGEDPYWGTLGYPGAVLSNNSNVVLQNCQVFGPAGYWNTYYGSDGYNGMSVTSTSLALYDSIVRGGDGGDSDDYGGAGGDGARASTSFVFSSNTTIEGGAGGNASGLYGFQFGGDGGDGLVLGVGTGAQVLNVSLVGGYPGNYGGARGVPQSGPGSINFLSGSSRSFSIDTVASDEALLNLSVNGPSGEQVFLLLSTSAGFSYLPALKGVSTTQGNGLSLRLAQPVPIGVIPAGGRLTTQVKLPALPGNVTRRRYFMQGYTFGSGGSVTLGSPLHSMSLNADSAPDCNGNGIQDYVELVQGIDPDCNGNLVVDACDILNGTSLDANGNGIPDECEEPVYLALASPCTLEDVRLLSPTPQASGRFGHSVVVRGQTAAIGAPDESSVHVFEWDGSQWNAQATLSYAPHQFGADVDCSQNRLVSGAYNDTGTTGSLTGSALVFQKTPSGWTQETKLMAGTPTKNNQFGSAVAIEGTTIVVGAANGPKTISGEAYVFVHDGTDWNQQAKLVPSDGTAKNFFGSNLSLSGDSVAIGARGARKAYVFVRHGSTWTEQAKLGGGYRFGASVSLDGDRLIVGEDSANSSGVAHVYERSGSTWSVAQVLQPDPPYFGTTTSGQYFGWSVDLQSGLAVVGAPGEINCNGRKGKTYVFKNGPSGWQRSDVLTGSDLAHFYTTSYGSSVTTDGKTIMVGAAEAAANRLGAVYVYPVQ